MKTKHSSKRSPRRLIALVGLAVGLLMGAPAAANALTVYAGTGVSVGAASDAIVAVFPAMSRQRARLGSESPCGPAAPPPAARAATETSPAAWFAASSR